MSHKQKLIDGLSIIIFPVIAVVFLLATSYLLSDVRRNPPHVWRFYIAFIPFALISACFLCHFVHSRSPAPWPALCVGLAELLLFHIPAFWRLLSHEIYTAFWSLFPLQYFVLGSLCVFYGLLFLLRGSKG